MRLLLAANNQATRRNEIIKSYLQLGSSSNRYAPRLPQQETKSSTKQLPPTGPILGPENLLKTGFAQKGLPSTARVCAIPMRPAMSTGETIHVCWIALVSATVARLKQSSRSSRVAPRRPPLRKPHPVWTMTAMRAVAPAADEEVDTRSPPLQVVWKPCWSNWLCTAVRLHNTRSWLVVPWRTFWWSARRFHGSCHYCWLSSIKANHTLDSQRLKVEHLIDISAVAEPPVAMRIRFCATMQLRSLQRTSMRVAYASPLPSSMRPSRRPKYVWVGGRMSLIWSARASAATFSFVNTSEEKSSISQLRAVSRTARDLVLPAPNTPAMQRSERPVSMARSSAMATAKTWPSPCPAVLSRLSRSIGHEAPPWESSPVRNRRRILTKVSVTLVFRSAAMRRTGMPGWDMPMAKGSRDGSACAKTNNSRRLRVSQKSQLLQDQRNSNIKLNWMWPVMTWVEVVWVLRILFN